MCVCVFVWQENYSGEAKNVCLIVSITYTHTHTHTHTEGEVTDANVCVDSTDRQSYVFFALLRAKPPVSVTHTQTKADVRHGE